ncbi:hypothetical protein FZI91_03685 [Mycobacterium sp. CBMA271]|uniref:hypothetical protein n=1 Tax=unclassified Mycobacteroides TaxID=2618759 RepID=UPI0012DC55C6|nr:MULTISPECIES: hypothetical protein [unclassified Mycobacteroides]MUM18221.1 hypothetical protein [Mycobacteroides sp. CBMA 326]MUM20808.1 hypothetical protein [Mycobacteroides sp. CBMA 271]
MRWFRRRRAEPASISGAFESDQLLEVGPFATFGEFFGKLSKEQWDALEDLIARIDAHEGAFGRVEVVNPATGELTLGFSEFEPITEELFSLWPGGRLRETDDFTRLIPNASPALSTRDPDDVAGFSSEEALVAVLWIMAKERMWPGIIVYTLEWGVMSALLTRIVSARPESASRA